MASKDHWERVYSIKAPDQVSWFRPHLETSLALIDRSAGGTSAAVIDVGGGASTLVDDLLERRYCNLTVLDVSAVALEISRCRLGARADSVHWVEADITLADLSPQAYDVWHDRAVFHFLTQSEQRETYFSRLVAALKAGGQAIIGTFGPEGPSKCSGLDVVRYDAPDLQAEFGERFRLRESCTEVHETPFGTTQQFLYCRFQLATHAL